MQGVIQFFGWLIFSIVALFVTLVLEVLLAMAVYIYLDLNHRDLFGALVGWARDAMNGLLDGLDNFAPDFYVAANQSLAGEVAAKAFLLLVLGLFASGVIRMVAWGVRRMFREPR